MNRLVTTGYLRWCIERGPFKVYRVAKRPLYTFQQLVVEWDAYRFHVTLGLIHFVYFKRPVREAL